jgi:Fanconi anemia group M protein
MTLYLDTREPDSAFVELTKRGLKPKLVKLEVGDIAFGNVVIERKTINDMLHSVKTNRLFNQLKNMTVAEKKLLVLVGRLPDSYSTMSKLKRNIILGALFTAWFSYGVPFAVFERESEYYDMIQRGYKRFGETGKGKKPLMLPKKSDTPSEMAEDMLTMIRGIGRGRAKIILKHFGTLSNLVKASPKDVMFLRTKKVPAKALTTLIDTFTVVFENE